MEYKEAMIWASAHYLTESFPKDWDYLDDDQIKSYIKEHEWEPLERWDATEILECIEALASDFQKAYALNRPTK